MNAGEHINQKYSGHRKHLYCLVALLFVGVWDAPGAEVVPPAWEPMESLFRADSAPPPPFSVDDGAPHPVEHHYLFEQFADLDCADFLRGLSYLIHKYQPPEDPGALPAYTRAMNYRLRVLFEYYPLAARGPDDFTALMTLISDGRSAETLRVFLLRQAAPGLEAPTTFGGYLQGHLSKGKGAFDKQLRELTLLPRESTRVQVTALDVLLARATSEYAMLLQRDPMGKRPGDDGAPVSIRDFVANPEAAPLSRRTKLLLERKNEEVGKWAASLQALATNGQRDGAVREKATEVLGVILRDFPIPNRADFSQTVPK